MTFGVGLFVVSLPTKAVNESCSKVAKVISLNGSVAYKPATPRTWYKLNANVNLCPNDQIKVGRNSRTSIRLNNNTVIRLKENSLLKLSPSKENKFVNLFQGIGHFISRVKKSFEVKTPLINAFVEGTEFLVSITPEQGKVTVLEGKVRTYNQHGTTSVVKGQSSVAKVGKAPVLLLGMYNSQTKPTYTQDQLSRRQAELSRRQAKLNRRQQAKSNRIRQAESKHIQAELKSIRIELNRIREELDRRQTKSNLAKNITAITSSQHLYADNEGAGFELVAPLNKSNNSFAFFNPKVYFNNEQSVLSLGAGIRSTNPHPFANVGVNAFFDASKTEETFTQYGLGLEIFNDIFSFNANYYQPTEEYKIAKTSTTSNSYADPVTTTTYSNPTFSGHEIYQDEIITTVNSDVTETNVFDTFEYTNKGFDVNLNIKLNKYITASLGYEEYEAFEEPFSKDKFSRSSASLNFALSKNLSLSLTGYDDEHDRDEKYHAVLTYNFKPQKTAHLNSIAAPVKRYNKGIKVFIADPILNTDKSGSERTITSPPTVNTTPHVLKDDIYYVYDEGTPLGDCTFETNCASITQAATLATAGATVFVTDGTYNENAAFGNGIDLTNSFEYTDLEGNTHSIDSTNNPQINGTISIGGDSKVNGFNLDRTNTTISASISDNQTIEITNNVINSDTNGIVINSTDTNTNTTALIDNNEIHSLTDGIQTNYINNLTITNNDIVTNELGADTGLLSANAIRVITGNGGITVVNNNTATTSDPTNASAIGFEASIANSTHCVIAKSNRTSSSTGFGLDFSNTNVAGGTILNVQGLANMEALNPELEFNDDTDKVSSSSATDVTACP